MSELLKSGRVGRNETQEEIVAAWKETGLLATLTDDVKIIVANAMEESARIILTGKYGSDWDLDSFVYPIIHRVYRKIMSGELNYNFKVEDDTNYNELNKFIINHFNVNDIILRIEKEFNNLKTSVDNIFEAIDAEAEVCAFMSDMIARYEVTKYKRSKIHRLENGRIMVFDVVQE